jgi:hypothetical protein
MKYLPELASNHDPPELSLPSSKVLTSTLLRFCISPKHPGESLLWVCGTHLRLQDLECCYYVCPFIYVSSKPLRFEGAPCL